MASQIPGFVTGSWQGLMAPARTPPAILDKLQDAVRRIVARPDFSKRLQELGSEPSEMNRQQIADLRRLVAGQFLLEFLNPLTLRENAWLAGLVGMQDCVSQFVANQ